VARLEKPDTDWAWNLGLTFGAWYPNPDVELATFGSALKDYAEPKLRTAMTSHGRRRFGTPFGADLTDAQITELLPYLQELGQTVSYAAEAALYYRRDAIKKSWRKRDPRLEAPNKFTLPKFAEAVERFRTTHPWILYHSLIPVRPVYSNGAALPRPPAAQPFGVSHAGAEHFVATWMHHLGALDARPTRISGDGGIDVVSAKYVAQVKNLAATSAVPVAAIRDLAGVASVDGRRAAMFTSGVYSSGGLQFANSAGIALFRYDALQGTLTPANELARGVLLEGMG
jgi:hypothetical protein